jgi:hypothetical protein
MSNRKTASVTVSVASRAGRAFVRVAMNCRTDPVLLFHLCHASETADGCRNSSLIFPNKSLSIYPVRPRLAVIELYFLGNVTAFGVEIDHIEISDLWQMNVIQRYFDVFLALSSYFAAIFRGDELFYGFRYRNGHLSVVK